MNRLTLFLLTAAALLAQPTVEPSPEAVGPEKPVTYLGYDVRQSFETGFRLAEIDGNRGKYRSDVNFRNGFRLLGSSLDLTSKNGKGKYFDSLRLTTLGLGNDPYQFTSLRIEKNQLYRYDMTWRANDYFNPGLTIAYGQHLENLQRRMQDHQFTLFPQGRFQFFGGYSRNSQDGPALTTVNLFDSRGNIFPVFENVRRLQDEIRFGGLVQFAGMKFFWQRGWELFKEDSRDFLATAGTPLDPLVTNTSLANLRRDQPNHGSTPHWRTNLFTERKTWFAINARFTHSAGRRNFIFDELANGFLRTSPLARQTLVSGDARRPVTSANLTFSLFPTDKLSITNHTAFSQLRMDGNSSITQLTNANQDSSTLNFQFLGIRTVTNSTIADYVLRPWISLQGGFQYADRRVRSVEFVNDSGFLDNVAYEQTNQLKAGTLGFRLRPVKGLTLVADGELGRQNRPFYTTSEKDYHAFGMRGEYKWRTFRLATQLRTNVNFNSSSLFRHSSRSRNYTFDFNWVPNAKIAIDAGYQKLHLDTITGLAYFASFQQVDGDRSYFVSNVHAAHTGLRLALIPRLDLYGGFSFTKDTGESATGFTTNPALLAAQSFPLTFVSPQVRLSYRFSAKMRWNAGWQYYNYGEKVLATQDYRAHTAFLSMLWSF